MNIIHNDIHFFLTFLKGDKLRRFFEGLAEALHGFMEVATILLIVLALGIVILSRLDKLFDTDLVADSQIVLNLGQFEDSEPVIEPQNAPIVYDGTSPVGNSNDIEVVTPEQSTETTINIVTFEILEGQTPDEVANTLQATGLIQDSYTFVDLLNQTNLAADIKPGMYKVPANIKNLDLIETITIAGEPNISNP